jgi:hypothetical protein
MPVSFRDDRAGDLRWAHARSVRRGIVEFAHVSQGAACL